MIHIVPILPRDRIVPAGLPLPAGLEADLVSPSGDICPTWQTASSAARGGDGLVRICDMEPAWRARWRHCGGSAAGATQHQYEAFTAAYEAVAGTACRVEQAPRGTDGWYPDIGDAVVLFPGETAAEIWAAAYPERSAADLASARNLAQVLAELDALVARPYSQRPARREDRLAERMALRDRLPPHQQGWIEISDHACF